MFEDFDWEDQGPGRNVDPVEIRARELLRDVFSNRPQRVYFSRQLEVQNEGRYFHWITNRAIRDLEEEGVILSERRKLTNGGTSNTSYIRGRTGNSREGSRQYWGYP